MVTPAPARPARHRFDPVQLLLTLFTEQGQVDNGFIGNQHRVEHALPVQAAILAIAGRSKRFRAGLGRLGQEILGQGLGIPKRLLRAKHA